MKKGEKGKKKKTRKSFEIEVLVDPTSRGGLGSERHPWDVDVVVVYSFLGCTQKSHQAQQRQRCQGW